MVSKRRCSSKPVVGDQKQSGRDSWRGAKWLQSTTPLDGNANWPVKTQSVFLRICSAAVNYGTPTSMTRAVGRTALT